LEDEKVASPQLDSASSFEQFKVPGSTLNLEP